MFLKINLINKKSKQKKMSITLFDLCKACTALLKNDDDRVHDVNVKVSRVLKLRVTRTGLLSSEVETFRLD